MIIDGMSCEARLIDGCMVMMFDKDGCGVDARLTDDKEPSPYDIAQGSLIAQKSMNRYVSN